MWLHGEIREEGCGRIFLLRVSLGGCIMPSLLMLRSWDNTSIVHFTTFSSFRTNTPLINQLAVERHSHCAHQKSRVSVRSCGRLNNHMESRNQLRRVHLHRFSTGTTMHEIITTYIVIDRNFWEENCTLSVKSKSNVSAVITS